MLLPSTNGTNTARGKTDAMECGSTNENKKSTVTAIAIAKMITSTHAVRSAAAAEKLVLRRRKSRKIASSTVSKGPSVSGQCCRFPSMAWFSQMLILLRPKDDSHCDKNE